ncbi:MAG: carbamate kinase [Bacteroidota bacterium]
MKNSILVAVGGNSLIRAGQRGTIAEQLANAKLTAESLAGIVARGYVLIVSHGNGPQVGAQLLRSEAGSSQTYTLPLDVCVAMTQGEIGFMLQNSMQTAFRKQGIKRSVVTLVTQVVVDKNDPAFQRPTKPIGPFYSKEVAERKRRELSWNIVEDAARGYRRVVASPLPKDVIELDVIKDCLEHNNVVIAVGGGGIPVILENGEVKGIEAVIDKDRASALLASKLGIEHLVISTEVPEVYLNYKKFDQMALRISTIAEAKRHLADRQFSEGSMKPKIEAALDFLSAGGQRVTITDPEHLLGALEGKAGTRITL